MGFLDYKIAYFTPKMVAINDYKLALSAHAFEVLILIYIFVFSLLINNVHLLVTGPMGSSQIILDNPRNVTCQTPHCLEAWTPLTKLAYCSQYTGTQAATHGDRLSCIHKNNLGQEPHMAVPGSTYMTSLFNRTKQVKGCTPDKSNAYACSTNLYDYDTKYPPQASYVAQVENYTIAVKPWLNVNVPNVHTGAEVFLQLNKTNLKEELAQGEAAGVNLTNVTEFRSISTGGSRVSGFPSVRINSDHFVEISLQDVLKLALGDAGTSYLDTPIPGAGLPRYDGLAVNLQVKFTNRGKWDFFGVNPARIEISAEIMPVALVRFSYPVPISATERYIDHHTGILVVTHVYGDIQSFKMGNLLLIVAQSMAMLAMSVLVFDNIMIYIPIFKTGGKGGVLKYQPWHGPHGEPSTVELCEEHKFDETQIYQMMLLDMMQEDRDLSHKELLALLAKLDHRLNHVDAFHMEHGSEELESLRVFIAQFEREFVIKAVSSRDSQKAHRRAT